MKYFRITLFLLGFIATVQIGLVFRTGRLIDMVDTFEPVVIEQAQKTETRTRVDVPAKAIETEIIRPKLTQEVTVTEPEPEETEETEEPEMTEVEPEAIESLGEFRVTAYCACEKCCGEWALNRPNGIVLGAAGVELKAGVSCASPLPFGTVIEIEGLGEYVVQDRIAQWVVDKYGENLIDIYFDDHEAASKFGLQYHNIYLKGETKNG
jgi:3D (Asp-Asp-Asp) domain-containing protein